jgi:glycosyltransferase involved in cell wall biosynthesis
MNILWIPHASWNREGQFRDQYLIEELKSAHEIHVLSWIEPSPSLPEGLNPIPHLRALRETSHRENGITVHTVRRGTLSRFDSVRALNQRLLRSRTRQLVHDFDIDVVIGGPSHYLNGFPPFELDVPFVFDYLDWIADEQVKRTYIENAAATLCVSNVIQEDADRYTSNAYYVPNGADIAKFAEGNGTNVRSQYGLENQCIVSLIGLTCSESLFFLNAFDQLSGLSDEYAFLLVGGKPIQQRIKRKAANLGIDVITPGWVDYEVIEDYFAATDVGLYPVDQTTYYDAASPIKIFEYTAAETPIVSTDLEEVRHLDFPNVLRAEPTSDAFRDAIIEVHQSEKYDEYPDLNQYRWSSIAATVEEIIQGLIE